MAITGIEARGSTWQMVSMVRVRMIGESGIRSYFANESVEWKAPIPSKRPNHTRCRGEEPDDRTPGKSDYDGSHHRRSSLGTYSIIEDLDERETGGRYL